MPSSTFVLFGSGPGIGLSVAKAFAQKHFDRIVLCARNAERLESERNEVEEVARVVGRNIQVSAFATDVSHRDRLRKTLKEIEGLGPVGCVYFNAASINGAEPLTASDEELEEDFRTGNLAVYIIAQWAVPLLRSSGHPSPSFLVTNSHFPEAPMPVLLSLSMSKASQQNLVICLNEAFGSEIHFGLIKACGLVGPDNSRLNPTDIAKEAVAMYEQEKGSWEVMVSIRD
ncbi:hypothetical protein LTR37_012151 [Vermiconidia calcicola]|uniref:Uncharacterized protein n=1 Tax=Vermiconidia calcicola TaxID=1690605 RepID=A0ACC3N069_9PEZI|nr:hypothetical protein LTR37_012151 [Vermiconidia calcicola]